MSVLAKDNRKLMLTDNPTYNLWFERFVRGIHNPMGDDIRQDLSVDVKVLHHMLEKTKRGTGTGIQL